MAPLLPAALSAAALDPATEWTLWTVSLVLALIVLEWPRPRSPLWGYGLWSLALGVGLAGLALAVELLVQASLILVAALQIYMAVKRVRVHRGHSTVGHVHGDGCLVAHHDAHDHCDHDGHRHGHPGLHANTLTPSELKEARTLTVVGLAAATMVSELVAGWWTGSLALVADGWHMATHVGALGLAWVAYAVSRKLSRSRRFAFGADKILALTGYTNAMALGVVAVLMLLESFERLREPVAIRFAEALPVAVLGLIVNLVSARLLHPNEHDHTHDHNLRAAYLHVIADIVTSVLAVLALAGGRFLGLGFLDLASAALGGVVILFWSIGLCRAAGRELLDVHPQPDLNDAIIEKLRTRAGDAKADVRVWPLGRGKQGCTVCITVNQMVTADDLRPLVLGVHAFDHLVIEVRQTRPRVT
jgi:cation diffusion facilitator family transporter